MIVKVNFANPEVYIRILKVYMEMSKRLLKGGVVKAVARTLEAVSSY